MAKVLKIPTYSLLEILSILTKIISIIQIKQVVNGSNVLQIKQVVNGSNVSDNEIFYFKMVNETEILENLDI